MMIDEHYYCDEDTEEDPTPVHRCHPDDEDNWINIKDKLPDNGVRVIVWNTATKEPDFSYYYTKKGFRALGLPEIEWWQPQPSDPSATNKV